MNCVFVTGLLCGQLPVGVRSSVSGSNIPSVISRTHLTSLNQSSNGEWFFDDTSLYIRKFSTFINCEINKILHHLRSLHIYLRPLLFVVVVVVAEKKNIFGCVRGGPV